MHVPALVYVGGRQVFECTSVGADVCGFFWWLSWYVSVCRCAWWQICALAATVGEAGAFCDRSCINSGTGRDCLPALSVHSLQKAQSTSVSACAHIHTLVHVHTPEHTHTHTHTISHLRCASQTPCYANLLLNATSAGGLRLGPGPLHGFARAGRGNCKAQGQELMPLEVCLMSFDSMSCTPCVSA